MTWLRHSPFRDPNYTFSKISREDRLKIGFQYTLVSLLAFVLGIVLCKMIPEEIKRTAEQSISIHFEIPFRYVSDQKEILLISLNYAKTDLAIVVVAFLSSLTLLCLPVCEILLFFQSGLFGVALALLLQAQESAVYPPNSLQTIIFICFRLLIIFLTVFYTLRVSFFSYSMRSCTTNGRMIFNHKFLLHFTACTLVILGTVILITGGYCFFIFII